MNKFRESFTVLNYV